MTFWVINLQVMGEQERPPEHSSPLASVAAASFIIQHHGEPPAAEENQCVSAKRWTVLAHRPCEESHRPPGSSDAPLTADAAARLLKETSHQSDLYW